MDIKLIKCIDDMDSNLKEALAILSNSLDTSYSDIAGTIRPTLDHITDRLKLMRSVVMIGMERMDEFESVLSRVFKLLDERTPKNLEELNSTIEQEVLENTKLRNVCSLHKHKVKLAQVWGDILIDSETPEKDSLDQQTLAKPGTITEENLSKEASNLSETQNDSTDIVEPPSDIPGRNAELENISNAPIGTEGDTKTDVIQSTDKSEIDGKQEDITSEKTGAPSDTSNEPIVTILDTKTIVIQSKDRSKIDDKQKDITSENKGASSNTPNGKADPEESPKEPTSTKPDIKTDKNLSESVKIEDSKMNVQPDYKGARPKQQRKNSKSKK